MTCAETIKQITRQHLEKNNGVALGQCLSAVGWVGGTVPEMTPEEGIVELSMADVAGGGIATGFALARRRPIYIVRYQGFQWYNATTVLNYAAKSKEMWGIPCPIFVRSIAMEGGIGPVASNSHHGIYMRMPGVNICAPMSPREYEQAWEYFMGHDDPLYVSEHRRSFGLDEEYDDVIVPDADITLLAISAARLNARDALATLESKGLRTNLIHLVWLKPFEVTEKIVHAVNTSRLGGVVLDGDYANGAAKPLAHDIMMQANNKVYTLALEERTAGFAPHLDNLPPTPDRILSFVESLSSL